MRKLSHGWRQASAKQAGDDRFDADEAAIGDYEETVGEASETLGEAVADQEKTRADNAADDQLALDNAAVAAVLAQALAAVAAITQLDRAQRADKDKRGRPNFGWPFLTFFTPLSGWVNAGDLEVGDTVFDHQHQAATVRRTEHEPHPEGVAVLNFTVAENHTYYVREYGREKPSVLVHNMCAPSLNPKVRLPRTMGKWVSG
ncbi:polymorphic toxin-type HINT domain-containing protein [Lignipirellula cremea]|uniref:Intein C-terminal splicing domain-containing protein n=1 Tax=Lignipirellula cremea TaxID=2528010 RepID=A0A518DV40_9BACT|nr:hypothetical protein Pla8534_35220 [Lignipirellula cremea]